MTAPSSELAANIHVRMHLQHGFEIINIISDRSEINNEWVLGVV